MGYNFNYTISKRLDTHSKVFEVLIAFKSVTTYICTIMMFPPVFKQICISLLTCGLIKLCRYYFTYNKIMLTKLCCIRHLFFSE